MFMCRRSSTQGVSGWNQNLHCYCRIDINDSNTKKVTIQSHIAIPNGMPITSLLNCKHLQLQPNKRSIISQSYLHNCFNTLPHRPISTILIVSVITSKNLPINAPKPITYLPNPLQTLSPPTDWVTSVQWTCAPWALNIPVMHRVATTLWP